MKFKRKQYRFFSILIILTGLFIPFFIGGSNYIIDPLQVYRKQHFRQARFWTDQRFQNAGKINSYLSSDEYSCLILGHSQSDNFLPSEVSRTFGWGKCLKLTVDGGTPREQAIMFTKAVKTGAIKHVFWGIGLNYASNSAELFNKNKDFPQYLYTSTLFDDGPYLFNLDIFLLSRLIILNKLPKRRWEKEMDWLNYWGVKRIKSFVHYSSRENLIKLQQKTTRQNNIQYHAISDAPYETTQINLINLIKKHPQIDFVLFFTPDSYLRYFGNPSQTNKVLRLRKSIAKSMTGRTNVKLFGFDDLEFIGGNIFNYRDLIHFNSGVNSYILESVANNRHRLLTTNYITYQSRFLKNLHQYQIINNKHTMIPFRYEKEQKKYNYFLQKLKKTRKQHN